MKTNESKRFIVKRFIVLRFFLNGFKEEDITSEDTEYCCLKTDNIKKAIRQVPHTNTFEKYKVFDTKNGNREVYGYGADSGDIYYTDQCDHYGFLDAKEDIITCCQNSRFGSR